MPAPPNFFSKETNKNHASKASSEVQSHPLRASIKILRKKNLLEKLGISNATLYDWLDRKSPRHDHSFPTAINLSVTGRGSVGWIEQEVEDWIASRISASRQ